MFSTEEGGFSAEMNFCTDQVQTTFLYNYTNWTQTENETIHYEHSGFNQTFQDIPSFYEELYDPPVGIIVVLSVLYGTISVLAVVGNSLVIWIVATSRRMQNVTNCFIANLALADIVIGLFSIPFQFQAALLQRWNLPRIMCPFCPFVQILSVNVSIFTLTAIAIDRHRAILNPLSPRPSKLRARLCIAAIWSISAMLATPIALATRVHCVKEINSGRTFIKPFCENVGMTHLQMMCYRFILFFLQYVTPLCIISGVYAHMGVGLWGSRAPGNAQDSRDATLMRNKKKVIKMLVIVVALFAICWLPLQTYNVLQYIFPNINEYRYINIIWFCCDWLAMSNSCYNPFIYGIYNEKFKREFKQRCPFRTRKWISSATESLDLDKMASMRYSTGTGGWSRTGSARWNNLHTANSFYRGISMRGGGMQGGNGTVREQRQTSSTSDQGVDVELYVFPDLDAPNKC